jgi:uncharacterized membrane protein YheB (UPF0754 family)
LPSHSFICFAIHGIDFRTVKYRVGVIMAHEYKSLITNLMAAGITLIGYFIPNYGPIMITAGYFALSGALTNWLAIYMLFERIPFLYGSGIIPLHFEEFKSGIKQLIMEQFFTENSIQTFFSKHKLTEELELPLAHVVSNIDFDYIFQSLTETILASKFGTALALFGGEKALLPLKEPMIEKLHEIIQQILKSPNFKAALIQEGISEEVHQKIEQMVDERLAELTPTLVKELIQNMMRKHLGWLVIWGAIFGGLIGVGLEVINLIKS